MAVAEIRGLKKSQYIDLIRHKCGRCHEAAVSGGSTVRRREKKLLLIQDFSGPDTFARVRIWRKYESFCQFCRLISSFLICITVEADKVCNLQTLDLLLRALLY